MIRHTKTHMLVLSVLFAMVSGVLAGQDLTASQQREYTRQALGVEVQTGFFGSFTPLGAGGFISGGSVASWRPTHGFSTIEEHEFFSMAGFDREAEEARKHNALYQSLLWSGVGIAAIGAGVGFYGLALVDSNTNWDTITQTGLGIMYVSLIPLAINLFIGERWAGPEQAASAAEAYNGELLLRLSTP